MEGGQTSDLQQLFPSNLFHSLDFNSVRFSYCSHPGEHKLLSSADINLKGSSAVSKQHFMVGGSPLPCFHLSWRILQLRLWNISFTVFLLSFLSCLRISLVRLTMCLCASVYSQMSPELSHCADVIPETRDPPSSTHTSTSQLLTISLFTANFNLIFKLFKQCIYLERK